MSYTTADYTSGQPVTRGIGTTVAQGSTYLGDGDSNYWVMVAVEGPEGWTFTQEGTGWYPPRDFVVDAPAEAIAAYEAKQAAQRAAATARYEETIRFEQMATAREPRRGRTVEVVRGRKVPVGTVAEVFWYGESTYGYRAEKRVGIVVEGEKVFTAAYNVEVVNPEQYAPEAFAVQAVYEAAQEVAA